MKRLLFVDHSYHARTRATQFLQELLAERYAVDTLWDDSWKQGAVPLSAGTFDAGGHDAIVFFQLLPRARVLRRLRCTNVTWVPMRDGLDNDARRLGHLSTGPVKVLNFCQEAHRFFSTNGFRSLGVQYWPDPTPRKAPARQRPRLFFWLRRHEIGWPTLKALLGDYRPERITLRYAVDPEHELPRPSADDVREYNIEVLDRWLEYAEYLRLLAECDIFMAPRPLEGIGQSVLDAMRLGLSVIAPDAPTMNEYVRDGHTGWLYSLASPKPLDFSGWAERGPAALAAVRDGRRRWLEQRGGLLEFVEASPPMARWDWRLLRLARL